MNNSKHLKKVLLNTIHSLAKEHPEFFIHPNTDFTRNRKLSFIDTITLILCMEAGSIKDELYKYFGLHIDNPTASAFVQQRGKIKYQAFQWIFDSFNNLTMEDKLYKGYRLLAVDGSTLPIRYDSNDKETYVEQGERKGFNAFHLNASYDLLECTYDDIIIQGQACVNENGAFYDLVDRYKGTPAIFIADRNYESYNSFEHVIHSGNNYLIRIKDITSNNSILSGFNEGGMEDFDIDYERILTIKQTNEIKKHPEKYRFLSNKTTFDYICKENPYYLFKCRVVRFRIAPNTYETIVTNLDRNQFSMEEIKELYRMRWGIETSFRELKYAVNLNALHAKKNDSIKQEIYARLVFYNFSERIMRKVQLKQSEKSRKYLYQINFTRAFHNIRTFLKYKKGGKHPPDIESIIAKEIEPIRPGRSDPRKIKPKSCVHFIYRFN